MDETPSFTNLKINLLDFQTKVTQRDGVVFIPKTLFDEFLNTFQFVIDSYESYYEAMHKLATDWEEAEMKRIFKELGEAGS